MASTCGEYSVEDLHSQIGVIFQDFMRYEMTARQNIAVGRIDDASDCRRSEAAAAKEPGRFGDSTGFPPDTRNCWGGASRAAWTFRAASGRRWRWRGPISAKPSF